MKASQTFLATLKEAPADAEVVSHQLMVRAGLIRKLSAGIYNYLPLGLKVIRKVENIIREEMCRGDRTFDAHRAAGRAMARNRPLGKNGARAPAY